MFKGTEKDVKKELKTIQKDDKDKVLVKSLLEKDFQTKIGKKNFEKSLDDDDEETNLELLKENYNKEIENRRVKGYGFMTTSKISKDFPNSVDQIVEQDAKAVPSQPYLCHSANKADTNSKELKYNSNEDKSQTSNCNESKYSNQSNQTNSFIEILSSISSNASKAQDSTLSKFTPEMLAKIKIPPEAIAGEPLTKAQLLYLQNPLEYLLKYAMQIKNQSPAASPNKYPAQSPGMKKKKKHKKKNIVPLTLDSIPMSLENKIKITIAELNKSTNTTP